MQRHMDGIKKIMLCETEKWAEALTLGSTHTPCMAGGALM